MSLRRLLILVLLLLPWSVSAQTPVKSLHQLQQEFVDLRFGMFVHFGLPTFQSADWTDPDLSPEVFYPARLDTDQWVRTAKSAGCKFICISVKHHAGFCMWNTVTTDYSVMSSPLHRDVLKELVNSLQKEGMQIMFHFSILDTHHRIRPTLPFTPEHTAFIKAQLRELLTNYGPVNTIMFDGWDAPWGRISYKDISFPEIYDYIKSIQPNCLVMDLNGSKYPEEALFYSDIRCYEQGAGQKISAEVNRLPAMACYPLQRTWFWKEEFPTVPLKDVDEIVRENIIPYNNAYCTYILNAAPNRDGLIDDNAVAAMALIGKIWKNTGHIADVDGLRQRRQLLLPLDLQPRNPRALVERHPGPGNHPGLRRRHRIQSRHPAGNRTGKGCQRPLVPHPRHRRNHRRPRPHPPLPASPRRRPPRPLPPLGRRTVHRRDRRLRA